MFDREIKLIGIDNFNKLKNSTVMVIGLGGVGGYAVESLTRAGIGKIILVDYDIIDISNINRQIIANTSNIGMKKTNEWKKRIKLINPECNVIVIDEYLTKDNIYDILSKYNIDYIIDACDTISVKKELIKYTFLNKIGFIASMGTGNKLEPSKLEITTLDKTSYDPIAKILRKYIKDEKINKKIYVVCSKEVPKKTHEKTITSISTVPSTAGLLVSSFVINSIINN